MNWTCPYCGQPTTVTEPNYDSEWRPIDIAATRLSYRSRTGVGYEAISCPNPDCKRLSLKIRLTKSDDTRPYQERSEISTWSLLPESSAKPQPEYIPMQIRQDYTEACRILNLSPKASATLSRRCLQGAIRDFHKISKPTLAQEIEELEGKVSQAEWDAIDAVRSVGNIGAHMEKDVNVIVDVDPDEADLLIQLIEDLFKDWYVARHDRDERQAKLKALAQQKKAQRKSSSPSIDN